MLTVLILTGAEKLINFAISTDKVTKAGLTPLSGKVLRLNMAMPELHLDVLFAEDHLRFEPVTTSGLFENSGTALQTNEQPHKSGQHTPDCTISVENAAQLLNLLRDTSGNLPIEGDYKVLMQLKQLIAGFDPDIAGQLEPLIGVPLASQLTLLINQLKGSWKHTAKHAFEDVSDWANDVAGNGKPNPEDVAEVDSLKQQLLKLRADVEREQAKLDAIKQQQAEAQQQAQQQTQQQAQQTQ